MTSKLFRFSTAAMALASAVLAQVEPQILKELKPVDPDDYYNPGEERGSFDWIMKPYPIPISTTTYVDFFFNIPDDAPELFHVTLGELINSQPLHLHHFFLTGCPNKISEDEVGMPVDSSDSTCSTLLGGWAPGTNIFGNTDLNTGVLMGRSMGVQSVQLNVHYTDGVYEDEATKTRKMATDGIRVHYTPEFRTYTTVGKTLIDVAFGPRSLTIPPGEERFFLTRTCRVNTSCKDVNPEMVQMIVGFMGMDGVTDGMDMSQISCPIIKPFCNMGGQIGPYIQRFCPESCGFCDKTDSDGNPFNNPLNSESYRITSIHYHAHLLGTEMYTTLLQEEDDEDTGTTAIQRDGAPKIVAKDVESRDFWLFDDQATIPLPYDTFIDDKLMRGTEIKIGDKIQATCVYNSSYRKDATMFSLSTYDEMCITTAQVTFDTPASLLNASGGFDDDQIARFALELQLMSFSCDMDEEFDVYSGSLTADEDGRHIWKDHPIESVTGCTYPVPPMGFGLFSTRNCESDSGDDIDHFDKFYEGGDGSVVCGNTGDDFEFMAEEQAGAECTGGTFDEQDLNTGNTETQCTEGGGEWKPYICGDIDFWLTNNAETEGVTPDAMEFIVANWYEPKCCKNSEQSEDSNELEEEKTEDELEDELEEETSEDELEENNAIISAARGSSKIIMPLLLAAAGVAAAMLL